VICTLRSGTWAWRHPKVPVRWNLPGRAWLIRLARSLGVWFAQREMTVLSRHVEWWLAMPALDNISRCMRTAVARRYPPRFPTEWPGIIRPCEKPSPERSASTRECHLRPKSCAGLQPGRPQAALYANSVDTDAEAADFHTGLAKPVVQPVPHTMARDDLRACPETTGQCR